MTCSWAQPAWQWISSLLSASRIERLGLRSSCAGQHAVHVEPARCPPRALATNSAVMARLAGRRSSRCCIAVRTRQTLDPNLHVGCSPCDAVGTNFERQWERAVLASSPESGPTQGRDCNDLASVEKCIRHQPSPWKMASYSPHFAAYRKRNEIEVGRLITRFRPPRKFAHYAVVVPIEVRLLVDSLRQVPVAWPKILPRASVARVRQWDRREHWGAQGQ